MFDHICKHLEVHQKYSAARRIFNSLFGVSKCDHTRSFLFDILLNGKKELMQRTTSTNTRKLLDKLFTLFTSFPSVVLTSQVGHYCAGKPMERAPSGESWGGAQGPTGQTRREEFARRILNEFTNSSSVLPTSQVVYQPISNGNRTEWSPIRSVIIPVITKSDDRAAGV